MIPFYSLIGILGIASSALVGSSLHTPDPDKVFVYYDAAVKHAAVPPPVYWVGLAASAGIVQEPQEFPQPVITPAPTPTIAPQQPPRIQPAPQPLRVQAPIAQEGRTYEEFSRKIVPVTSCESGGDYATNTGNGYYGAWQFDLKTWYSVGGTGLPSNASAQEQNERAYQLYLARGWQPWPHCGLRS